MGREQENEKVPLRKLVSKLRKKSSRISLTVADAGMIHRSLKRASRRLKGKKGTIIVGRKTVAFDGEMAFIFPGHGKVSSFIERLRKRGMVDMVCQKPKVYVGPGLVIAAIVLYRNEIVARRRWSEGVDELVLSLLISEFEGEFGVK
ncbi:MAG TPA: hypothetical protein ENG69_04745 [Candidatus Korarchaeota archaeon]|nr:hypothetical protein [Candidatus Korarchaeota archaeon]